MPLGDFKRRVFERQVFERPETAAPVTGQAVLDQLVTAGCELSIADLLLTSDCFGSQRLSGKPWWEAEER